MPGAKSKSCETLLSSALKALKSAVYLVVSNGDIERETNVRRVGVYRSFAGNVDLFHDCSDRYQEAVDTAAFSPIQDTATRAMLLDPCPRTIFDVRVLRACSDMLIASGHGVRQ